MKYAEVVETYQALEATASRLEMTELLADLFRRAATDEISELVLLLQGKVAPDYVGLELQVAAKQATRAVAELLGRDAAEVEQVVKARGDVGRAGRELLPQRPGGRLSIHDVFGGLRAIAEAQGPGSQQAKRDLLKGLLEQASPAEAEYILRTVVGKLRLGVGDMTVLDALAVAFTGDKANRPTIERAYNLTSDLAFVADTLAREGLEGIARVQVQVGRPIRPMLAERLETPEEIMHKLGGRAAAEYKYDGERLQVHHTADGRTTIYSRRMENITHQFPDMIEHLQAAISGTYIVELECVPVEPGSLEIRPFQFILNRKVKRPTRQLMEENPVRGLVFDLLYHNGRSFLDEPYPVRRAALEEAVQVTEWIDHTTKRDVSSVEELEAFFDEAVEAGMEGVLVKSVAPESVYQPGKRGFLWIKYKRSYGAQVTDTVDLVVVGAWFGKGSRAGTYGSLLMASYNPQEDVFETVTKLGAGFTQVDLEELPKRLEPYRVPHRHPRVKTHIEPDVWFAPGLVLEVLPQEITLSPSHTCAWGAVQPERGLALRFPRFTGRYRDDKRPEDATTSHEIVEMYREQSAGHRR